MTADDRPEPSAASLPDAEWNVFRMVLWDVIDCSIPQHDSECAAQEDEAVCICRTGPVMDRAYAVLRRLAPAPQVEPHYRPYNAGFADASGTGYFGEESAPQVEPLRAALERLARDVYRLPSHEYNQPARNLDGKYVQMGSVLSLIDAALQASPPPESLPTAADLRGLVKDPAWAAGHKAESRAIELLRRVRLCADCRINIEAAFLREQPGPASSEGDE